MKAYIKLRAIFSGHIRFIAPLFLMLLWHQAAKAQGTKSISLWPEDVPGQEEDKGKPVYKKHEAWNTLLITRVTNPVITVHRPDDSVSNGKGLIVCPGGGYKVLSMDKEGSEIAQWLNDLGYTAFVLQYRVPGKRRGALQDLQRAFRVVRDQAAQWQIDPDHIGVIGFSAGGSLAARASTRYLDVVYQPVDERDSLSAKPDFALLIYPAYLDQGESRSLTPALEVNGGTPPMFLFATADDKYANSALVMAQALRDAKVPVELHMLPIGGHGYGLRNSNPAARTWPQLAEKWLLRYD